MLARPGFGPEKGGEGEDHLSIMEAERFQAEEAET